VSAPASGAPEPSVQALYERLKREGEAGGYLLNPDLPFTLDLVRGLLTNTARYGYPACPCRLASGERAEDLDIICPCDYRDPDLVEHGMCYCALYVSDAVARGDQPVASIPDRRAEARGLVPSAEADHAEELVGWTANGLPIWRCKVCGYLCARESPPLKCPVCKADSDRFELVTFTRTR
jgi:ferredoxin-thioredoxin reductase catalytic chain